MGKLSLQNISVGKQIFLLPLIALVGLFVIIVMQYLSMEAQSSFDRDNKNRWELTKDILHLQQQMTRIRLSEKEFISTHSIEATRKHRDAMRSILKTLEKVNLAKEIPLFDKEIVSEWRSMLDRYQELQVDSADEIAKIGFSQNMGLRGSMRNAVHIIEGRIKGKNHSLMEDMLQMRRQEKDYIIRREDKFYQRWEKSIPVFMKNVETSKLSPVDRIVIKLSMPIYVDSFRQIKELTIDHVSDGYAADKISTKILQSITSTFGDLSYRANAGIQANSTRVRSDFVFLLGLTLLIAALVATTSGFIGSALRNNLLLLAGAMTRLAKGDVYARISVSTFKNELGMMANALRVFRDSEQKKLWAEINLKNAQEHTENIIESLNESLFEIDTNGVIIRANKASAKLWETSVDKLLGQRLVDLFVSKTEEEQKYAEQLAQLAFTQNRLEEMKLISSDQAVSFMEKTKVPLLLIAEDGTIAQTNAAAAGMLGYVTEELRGQEIEILIPEAFRKNHHSHVSTGFSQKTARLMADGRGLTAQHKDGHEIEISIGLAHFTIGMQPHMLCVCIRKEDSLAPDTITESTLRGLFNGFGINSAVAQFATSRGQGMLREDEIITANGAVVPITVSGSLMASTSKSPPGAIVTIQDITKRKQNERKILQFKQVLDQSCDQVIMFWSETYEIFYLNDTARHQTGWSVEDYSKKTLLEFNPDFNPNEFSLRVEPLISGEKQQIIYERIESRTGNSVEVSVEYIFSNKETKAYFVAVVRDISERKIAETAKADFIATISHELRTPLTSIKGALGLIKSGAVGELNDKIGHLVSIALSNSDRLIGLVNDILDIEKASAGKMSFKFEPMDICELVHYAIEANHGYAKTYGVSFKYIGVDTEILVKGDKDKLMQVMSNLMSNAAKFSKKGQDIEISLKCESGKVRVQVKDTGSGIPEAAQATIFDKFTQADSSDKRQKGGTGLGLSIVKTMVEAHGSKIAFNSVEGKGTAFYFDLDLLE